MKNNKTIELDAGGGGYKSWELLKDIRGILKYKGKWKNCEDDAAVFDLKSNLETKSPSALGDLVSKCEKLVFTTDAFIVDPLFFPGGDIGKIAMC
ncbi:MAG TPA: hypothetical protein ENH22_00075, partial [Candidatus Campbellbacteria bacterium]|nr:hypothetical protein [Candidatus Campbellbacteria bacterium]